MKCPTCQDKFETTDKGVALPFCSDRCKYIDLGRWLDEGYSVPFAGMRIDVEFEGDEPLDES